jgi:hypothetical protein
MPYGPVPVRHLFAVKLPTVAAEALLPGKGRQDHPT